VSTSLSLSKKSGKRKVEMSKIADAFGADKSGAVEDDVVEGDTF
jgi:hypothetical protein